MKVERIELYNDGIGFVEKHDFSKANMSQESRIEAVTTVASICYEAPKIINSINIYDRLGAESLGLPSSSYEFVPVLINQKDYYQMTSFLQTDWAEKYNATLNIEKYGEWIEDEFGEEYLLTNLRACLSDQSKYEFDFIDLKEYFNTDLDEIHVIRQNFKVFYKKIPLFVARQLVRHRASFQELSRRYTDDESSPIEFYAKDSDMKGVYTSIYHMNLRQYKHLIAQGEEPEDARAVLPTALYTKLWTAFTPSGYDNFIKLRTKKNAQSEIRQLAEGFEKLVSNEK